MEEEAIGDWSGMENRRNRLCFLSPNSKERNLRRVDLNGFFKKKFQEILWFWSFYYFVDFLVTTQIWGGESYDLVLCKFLCVSYQFDLK